jgi:hypothetical protein
MGQNKYAAQFTQSREEVVNHLQRTLAEEGYLVAEQYELERSRQYRCRPPFTRMHRTKRTWTLFGPRTLRQSQRGDRNYKSP